MHLVALRTFRMHACWTGEKAFDLGFQSRHFVYFRREIIQSWEMVSIAGEKKSGASVVLLFEKDHVGLVNSAAKQCSIS